MAHYRDREKRGHEEPKTEHRPSLVSVVGAVVGKEGGSPPEHQGRSRHRGGTPHRGKGGRSHTPPARGRSRDRKHSPCSHGGVYKHGAAGGHQSRPSHHRTKMGKDRTGKDEYIGPNGEYLYVCNICREAGKEKYWYTRQTSLDRHVGTHRPEALGCPAKDCDHQVREARLPDLRVHLATLHRGEGVAKDWDPGAPVMLRFDVETAGPSHHEETAEPAPASIYSLLTKPGYEIGEESEADIAESADFLQKLLGGTPDSIRRDLLGEGEQPAGQLLAIAPFKPLTAAEAMPNTRGSGNKKRKAKVLAKARKKQRKATTTTSPPETDVSPGLAAATFHPDTLSPAQVKFVLQDLCRQYGRGEGDTPTRMLLNLARTRPDPVLNLDMMRAEYEKGEVTPVDLSADKVETSLHSRLDLSTSIAPENLLATAKGKLGTGPPKGRRSEESLSAVSPVKASGSKDTGDTGAGKGGKSTDEETVGPGTSTPADISMEELEGHEDLAARYQLARQRYEEEVRQTKHLVHQRAEKERVRREAEAKELERKTAEKAEKLRLEKEAEDKRILEEKRVEAAKAEETRKANEVAESKRKEDEKRLREKAVEDTEPEKAVEDNELDNTGRTGEEVE